MSNLDAYLEKLSMDDYRGLIPGRRAIIEKAGAEMPACEFNANKLAAALHPVKQFAVVAEVTEQNGAKTYRLEPDAAKGTKTLAYFRAGQYVSVSLDIGKSRLTRAYTLAGTPKQALEGSYSVTVKKTDGGFASDYILENWKKGTKVELSAPEGSFTYEPVRDAAQVVAVAGGSGITPFISMAGAIADGTEDFALTILCGCRTEGDILYKEELDRLAENEKISVHYVLSEEEKDGYDHGFITAELIKKYAPEGDFSVFLCGPQAMYGFAEQELAKLGIPKRRIRAEVAGELHDAEALPAFPEEAKGKTFRLTVETAGGKKKIIPAKSSESILVALERAGIRHESRCRSGECGFCRARLASGSFFVPEDGDKRRAADAKDGIIHPCCSFPTSDCHILLGCDKGKKERTVKNMAKKTRAVSIIMAIIMSAAMGALMTWLSRQNNPKAAEAPAVPAFVSAIIVSIIIGVLTVLIIPLGKWGKKLAGKADPTTMKFTLLNCLPVSVVSAVIVSAAASFFGMFMGMSKGGAPMNAIVAAWVPAWLKSLPISIIVSYVLAVIISPMVVQMVGIPKAAAELAKAQAEAAAEAKKED